MELSKSMQNFNKIFVNEDIIRNMLELTQDYAEYINKTAEKGTKNENNE